MEGVSWSGELLYEKNIPDICLLAIKRQREIKRL